MADLNLGIVRHRVWLGLGWVRWALDWHGSGLGTGIDKVRFRMGAGDDAMSQLGFWYYGGIPTRFEQTREDDNYMQFRHSYK